MVSCLPVPPGPSDARRCLLIFQPAARPRPAVPEGAALAPNPPLDPAQPQQGPAPAAAGAALGAVGPAAAGTAASEPGSDPCPNPAADAVATGAAPALLLPAASPSEAAPEPPAAPSATGAGALDAAGQASAASEPSSNPSLSPAADPPAAEQHVAAAHMLRAMALVDGTAPESPFVRASAGFQARAHLTWTCLLHDTSPHMTDGLHTADMAGAAAGVWPSLPSDMRAPRMCVVPIHN